MSLEPGTKFGPYQIVSLLGSGGMGEVYRARDPRLGREVALKVLSHHVARSSDSLQRLEREAKVVAALSHPNVIAIYDIGMENGASFVVTELLEGETLRKRVERAPLGWREAAEIAMAIADGLSAAHSKGIIHRDVKPENIFLTNDGRVKVLDFGLAHIEAPPTDDPAAPITRPGAIMGSIGYMSPEQVRGLTVDARSDIFLLGCVIYNMLTGKPPFGRVTVSDTLAALLRDEPAPLDPKMPLPPQLKALMLRCLQKDPAARYQTAREIYQQLRALIKDASSPSLIAELQAIVATPPPAAVRAPEPAPSARAQAQAQPQQPVNATGPAPALPPARRRWPALVVGVAVSAAFAFGATRMIRHQNDSVDSVAILPFINGTHDPESDYLSDGVAESIINDLSSRDLRVIARSVAFRYRGREIDPKKVGTDLSVRSVLTGEVLKHGDQISIQVELVDTANGTQLWGHQYTRSPKDLLSLQQEISNDVYERLRPNANQRQKRQWSAEQNDAYQLYLRGRYYANKISEEGINRGIQYFQQAIDRDPGFAPAYSGMADCYAALGFSFQVGTVPPSETIPKAQAAIQKALAVDDSLAEAHTTIAIIKFLYEWDFSGAEKEFKRAIQLNPKYPHAHHWYSHYLIAMGRFPESEAESKRALDLNPLDVLLNAHLGWHYLYAEDWPQAIEWLRKSIEMDPLQVLTHRYLSFAYLVKGMKQQALDEMKTEIHLTKNHTSALSELGYTYGALGNKAEAEKVLAELNERAHKGRVDDYFIAQVYAGMGDKDHAFEWLERAFQHRSDLLVYMKVEGHLAGLRGDPRFNDLLKRVGIAP